MREDELEECCIYQGTGRAYKECAGWGEGGYAYVSHCEVFSEGLLDLC